MQIPKQIYFKQTTPKGGKLTATIEGDDLPNIIQIKGTNDIAEVKRKREHSRPERNDGRDGRDGRERDGRDDDFDDDDEYDRDDRGCHRPSTGIWESKYKHTTLKQTLLFIKKRHCKRVVQEASYDAQGKLIEVTPTATIKDNAISITGNTVEIRWTSVQEVLLKEFNAESKLSSATTWNKFDVDTPLGAGTTYTSSEAPTVSGSYDYRLLALFTDNTSNVLLTQTVNVTVPTGGDVTIESYSAAYNTDSLTIDVAWTSVTEVALLQYAVQLKGSLDTEFFNASLIDAIGPQQPYVTNLFEAAGTYTVRLAGILADGTVKVIDNTTVQVTVTE